MREFLKIEGEGDEDVSCDGHGNADDHAIVEFGELYFGAISWQAVHGGLEITPVVVKNEDKRSKRTRTGATG